MIAVKQPQDENIKVTSELTENNTNGVPHIIIRNMRYSTGALMDIPPMLIRTMRQ
jgi:hypothetical protein